MNPYAPPKSDVGSGKPTGLDEYRADLEKLPVSERWKFRFRVVEKAGGPSLPRFGELGPAERPRVIFNLLALLLGPFYYAALGMWRKAIVLFGVVLVAVELFGWLLSNVQLGHYADYLLFGAPVVFATRANIDYYKRRVLGEDGWW